MTPFNPARSLRLRLLLGTLVWIIASILIAGLGLAGLFRQHVANGFHAELTTHLDQLTARLELDAMGQPILSLPLSDPRFDRPLSGLYWQIDRLTPAKPGQESALLRSRSLWDQRLQVPNDSLIQGRIHQHRIPGPDAKALGLVERSLSLDGQSLRLMVAADEALMAEPVARFQTQLWLALGLLGSGLGLAALVQVFIGLRPLKALQAALVEVRTGRRGQLEGRFPVEITPLIEEFNRVLTQNAEVVERARTQAGNLAHALKTPLTILSNAAQASQGQAGDRDEDSLAALVLTQVEQARSQVDYHLARAKAAASRHLPGAVTLLMPQIKALVRTMERLHLDRQLEIQIQSIPPNLAFRGEEQDLQEMLGNLLDNACKWAQTRVAIEALHQGDWLLLRIEDDGQGLEDAQRQAVLGRGVRSDEHTPGTGLGLAIVADLAQLYGGDLQLHKAKLGGLGVLLRLPAV